jgi:hypothetical protein
VTTPEKLRKAVERDLEPAKPLRSPSVRALALLPLAAAIVILIPALHAFRSDITAIGFLRGWGFSIGQSLAGLVIVGAALRESIPGRALSRTALVATVVAGFALPFVLLAFTASSWTIGAGDGFEAGASCFRISAIAAVPALLVAALLAARAFPVRPAVAGALYGLGCGLVADAGLRLYCDYTAPLHVIFGHGGAVVTVTAMGAVVAAVASRKQR